MKVKILFLSACFTSVAAASPILAAAPAASPSPRLVVPGKVVNVVDGDTIDIEVSIVVRVRLLAGENGCWAPESHAQSKIADEVVREAEKERGLASKAALEKLALGKQCLLDVSLLSNRLIDHLTLERLLGNVYVDGQNIGQAQVRARHASTTRGGKLGL